MEDDKQETVNIRFTTPTPGTEADGLRFQIEPPQRGESSDLGRRGTGRRGRNEAAGLLGVDGLATNARDFESAIISDDGSSRASGEQPRRNSVSARHGRRSTFRRHHRVSENLDGASDTSSDRSLSPPNSVEAFAEPRKRGRAGTFTSIAPSYQSDGRAGSINTRNWVRSVSQDQGAEEAPAGPDGVSISKQPLDEDDICFPQEETMKPNRIDFDDLQDFVDRGRDVHPFDVDVPHPFGGKQDMKFHATRSEVLNDLRKKDTQSNFPFMAKDVRELQKVPTELSTDTASTSSTNEKQLEAAVMDKPGHASEQINRWSFFSSELEDTIHAPELGDLLMPGETFEHLFELGPDGGVWWLDMLMPSEEEVEVVCKAFGIHGLTREDIIQQETREKVELFKSYYFVCFRSFYQMDRSSQCFLEPVNVYAVVFREGILTFTFCPSPHASNVRQRMSKLRDFVALGADWICYALIDDIVDSFGPVIRRVELATDHIDDEVFVARPEDSLPLLRKVGECRKTVMSLLRLLGGKADVIKGFAKRCNEQYEIAPRKDVGLYLSDIQDHIVTMISNLAHFEKMLSRSHSNYLAQIQVDNAILGNKANSVLNKVTFVASVFVPMNLVCGMFGMNVDVPGRSSAGLSWFFGIVGCLFLFAIICTIVARRMRFI